METIISIFLDGITDSLESILRIAIIIIPIMVVIEIARACNILERISSRIEFALRFLTLPREAAFPLVVGVFFGIVYGAALIIAFAREGTLHKRDLMLTGVFLCICHAAIEDTLIFLAFGANAFIIFGFRLLLAVLITRIAALLIDYSRRRKMASPFIPDGKRPFN